MVDGATGRAYPSTSPLDAGASMSAFPSLIYPASPGERCRGKKVVLGATTRPKPAAMVWTKTVRVGCAGDHVLFAWSTALAAR